MQCPLIWVEGYFNDVFSRLTLSCGRLRHSIQFSDIMLNFTFIESEKSQPRPYDLWVWEWARAMSSSESEKERERSGRAEQHTMAQSSWSWLCNGLAWLGQLLMWHSTISSFFVLRFCLLFLLRFFPSLRKTRTHFKWGMRWGCVVLCIDAFNMWIYHT